jgi:hypothetical protein
VPADPSVKDMISFDLLAGNPFGIHVSKPYPRMPHPDTAGSIKGQLPINSAYYRGEIRVS